ncbi:MAG TPA: hypothetical protein VG028_01985 [Terriglobia bacterium]|nr:hypothetical protein [Terriglobia bacterium]
METNRKSWAAQLAEEQKKHEESQRLKLELASVRNRMVSDKLPELWEELVSDFRASVKDYNDSFQNDPHRAFRFNHFEPELMRVDRAVIPLRQLDVRLDRARRAVYFTSDSPSISGSIAITCDESGNVTFFESRPITAQEVCQSILRPFLANSKPSHAVVYCEDRTPDQVELN